ncbi:hypothetical protein [Nostoc sp. DedQUE03]|nr:hypothetical protein [Nostoc sp. DedQUE03]MDZ8045381.1 hypothetical protein [Nostoc sp. DedQUE02]
MILTRVVAIPTVGYASATTIVQVDATKLQVDAFKLQVDAT